MQSRDVQFSVISDSAGFRSLREPWNELCGRLGRTSVFLSFDWCWNAWEFVAEPRGYHLRLLIGKLGGRIVLILPLMAEGRVLRMLSAQVFEYRDVIVEASEHASHWIDEAWRYLTSSMRADAFLFQNLQDPSALGRKLAAVPVARRVGSGSCAITRLSRFADWEAYKAALPKSLVSDQPRRWKRLKAEVPGVTFRIVDRRAFVRPVMDWICEQKEAWAAARGIPDVWFADPDKRKFLDAFAHSALDNGAFVLAVLSDGEKLVAAGWGYRSGSEFVLGNSAYDPAYARCSPARLYFERLVQWCFEQDIGTLDWMLGDEDYKRTWATEYVSRETYCGALNWRGELLMRLQRRASRGGPSTAVIERLYRLLR